MGVFKEWANLCINKDDASDPTELIEKAKGYCITRIASYSQHNDKKPTHCSDIALLISEMERPLSSKSNDQKVKALSYLVGFLDGICMNHLDLSCEILQSIGRFFVEHCRPIVLDPFSAVVPNSDLLDETPTTNDKYCAEDVRDSALCCICALIKCSILASDERKDEIIRARVMIMQDAIQGRCATVEDEYEDESDGDGIDERGNAEQIKMLSGLALLPRAKRSLCFNVIESTLGGIADDFNYHFKRKIELELVTSEKLDHFVRFVSACLYGTLAI